MTRLLDTRRLRSLPQSYPDDILRRMVRRELSDGSTVLQLEHTVVPDLTFSKAVDANSDDQMPVGITASTGHVDRMRDVIDPAGWDLKNYLNNPVLLSDHRYQVDHIVGTAQQVGVIGAGAKGIPTLIGDYPTLIGDYPPSEAGAEFRAWKDTEPDDVETKPKKPKPGKGKKGKLRIRGLVDGASTSEQTHIVRAKLATRSLRTVSVGFRPLAWEKILDKEGDWTGGYLFTAIELLEVSFVAVPANPFALIDGKATDRADATSKPALGRSALSKIDRTLRLAQLSRRFQR